MLPDEPTNPKSGVNFFPSSFFFFSFFQQPKLNPFEENKSHLFLCLLLTVVLYFIRQAQEKKLSKCKLLQSVSLLFDIYSAWSACKSRPSLSLKQYIKINDS